MSNASRLCEHCLKPSAHLLGVSAVPFRSVDRMYLFYCKRCCVRMERAYRTRACEDIANALLDALNKEVK